MPLLALPNELLERIIQNHDTPSPFDLTFHLKPKSALTPRESDNGIRLMPLSKSSNRCAPLKSLTLTCQLLRNLTRPILFHCAVVQPLHQSDFLAFLTKHSLKQHVSSLVAYLPGHYSHIHPAWWARLLNEVPATRISIVAAPEVLAELAGTATSGYDSWAFDMPLQLVRFEQSSTAARSGIDYDNLPEFLAARPWQNMAYNEGSSISAYTTYEFFLRKTPSIFTALDFTASTVAEMMFSNLLSFDFVAIFPFYNHVEEVLKCIRKMKNLKRLKVKLCPDPGTSTFDDEIEAASGSMDIHDPWNECETSWTLIAHTVLFLTMEGDLRELHMDDVKVVDVRETLEGSMNRRLHEWWQYQEHGSGIWRRDVNGAIRTTATNMPLSTALAWNGL